MINFINLLKFKLIRIIESNPKINLIIYNNISLFKLFLPHEKDYYGIKLLINNKKNDSIVDVGGNLGFHLWDLENWDLKIKYFYLNQINIYFKNI